MIVPGAGFILFGGSGVEPCVSNYTNGDPYDNTTFWDGYDCEDEPPIPECGTLARAKVTKHPLQNVGTSIYITFEKRTEYA
jgi:hypothetical protein